jgi:hypothetical protein
MQTTRATRLGIIRDGWSLLTSVTIDPDKPHLAAQEAERIAQGWRSYFTDSRIDVRPLAYVGKDGWRLAQS